MAAEPTRLRGRAAAPGMAAGPIAKLRRAATDIGAAGAPDDERAALEAAVARASDDLAALAAQQTGEGADILEFQIVMLADDELTRPAFEAIAAGRSAAHGWTDALEAQIADYEGAADPYFRARTADLADLRDRVLRALAGTGETAPGLPEGAIVVAEDLPPSRFLELDWTRFAGVALRSGSATSHVAMLARARGVPMVVGLGAFAAADGALALLDAEQGEIEIDPTPTRLADWRRRRQALDARRADERAVLAGPAFTASGRRIRTLINIAGLADLEGDAAHADGIGLVRTEFLFEGGPPNEETQFRVYRDLLAWAGARPVTIRTLDAGGDKPIPGVTLDGEANPFLGIRGLRLSLRRPDLFRTQLRALARAAAHGALKVMVPMVTVPGELAEARAAMDEAMRELAAEGVEARRPALGMMVEVPAAAIAIARFDADFYSIGSNDLVQYVTACDRSQGALTALADPLNPAVLELIARVAAHGKASGAEVSLCGDMAADPGCVAALIDAGLEALSVSPPALARLKAAIRRHG